MSLMVCLVQRASDTLDFCTAACRSAGGHAQNVWGSVRRYDPGFQPGMRRHSVAETAYVLIQTEVGKAAQVATEVAKIEGIVGADDVTGPYDVIARAEANTLDELGKMVVSKVQLIDGIT